jgi:hypothetical protein
MPKTIKYLANWRSLYDEYPNKDLVTAAEFRLILKVFHNLLCNAIFEGKVFKFPFAAGVLGLIKRQQKRKQVDYTSFNATQSVHEYRNHHSEGYTVKSLWIRNNPPLFLKRTFKFKLQRQKARQLAQLIKHEGYIYKYREENENYFN